MGKGERVGVPDRVAHVACRQAAYSRRTTPNGNGHRPSAKSTNRRIGRDLCARIERSPEGRFGASTWTPGGICLTRAPDGHPRSVRDWVRFARAEGGAGLTAKTTRLAFACPAQGRALACRRANGCATLRDVALTGGRPSLRSKRPWLPRNRSINRRAAPRSPPIFGLPHRGFYGHLATIAAINRLAVEPSFADNR